MTKSKTPGVAFYGKVRIPTRGHKTAIDQAKAIAKKVGGKLTIGLSGTSEPLDIPTKKSLAEKLFKHPVHVGTDHTKTLSHFLTHLNKSHDHLHLVAGSDRVNEYKSFLDRYNGKQDKKGNIPFHFKSYTVHAAGGERQENNKDPRKMSDDELTSSVSASKLEKLAKEGNYEHFAAYHRGLPNSHIRRVYSKIRAFHGLNESVTIGLTFARKEMPQIGASKSFIKYLKDNEVQSVRKMINPDDLRSSQMEFDDDKINAIREKPSKNPIIVSNDGYVLDGHHRWLADQLEGRNCDAYVCNLPILDLMHKAKHYNATSLNEEITRKQLAPMLDSFVSFASDKLGLKSMPTVRYKRDDDDYNSFAAYNPSSNELSVATLNRHPMDIFRSVAHELVHHKQNEDGRIGKDIAKEGETGSDIENEANAEAGKIMRWFAKSNPNMFGKTYVVETNTAAMGGGIRGLGNVTGEVSPDGMSQYVLDNQAYTQQIQNSTEGLYTLDKLNSWLDKKGSIEYHKKAVKGFKAVRAQLNEGINDPGKLKAIFLAGGPGSGKDFVMNSALAGEGLREVNSDNAFEYLMKKHGLDMEMPEEEKIERDIVRGRAKNITKEQERLALAGRLGLIINGTADDLEKIKTIKKNLEADGYETMMVFVNTSNEVSRQRNVDRGKGGGRKVPDGTDKQGAPNGSEDIRTEKWELAQKNLGELQKVFGNDKFVVIDNSVDIRKATPEVKEKVLTDFSRVRRMAQQFVRAENQNPAAKKWIEAETKKRGITYQEPKRYKTLIQPRQSVPQVIHKPDNELMAQARRLGLSYYGFGRFGRRVNGVNKVMFHSKGGKLVRVQTMNEEKKTAPKGVCWKGYQMVGMKRKDGRKVPNCVPVSEEKKKKMIMSKKGKVKRPLANVDERFEKMMEDELPLKMGYGLPIVDQGLGPETTQYRQMAALGFGAGLPLSESILSWVRNERTHQKFYEKYGDLWEERLIDTAIMLEEAGCGCEHSNKKSVKKIKEGMGLGYNDMGTVSTQRKDELDEGTPAWQRKEGKDPEGGLNRKGIASYRRANPGSKLSMAVTTKPSKLKKGSKKAKRRLSFCRRMKGMKNKLTSAKTARDPNSRINKSLRKWNCEEQKLDKYSKIHRGKQKCLIKMIH